MNTTDETAGDIIATEPEPTGTDSTPKVPAVTRPFRSKDQVAALIPEIETMEAMWMLANKLAKSGALPKSLVQGKNSNQLVADVFAVMMHGAAVGFAPMQAIQQIGVINGKTTIYGAGIPALLYQHPEFEWIKERMPSEIDENHPAECTLKRKGHAPRTYTFSFEDAKKAGLLKKSGVWQTEPELMMMYKARNRNANAYCADMLMGLYPHEEALDIPNGNIKDVTPSHEQLPPPADNTGKTDLDTPAQTDTERDQQSAGDNHNNGARRITENQLRAIQTIYEECKQFEEPPEWPVMLKRYFKRDIAHPEELDYEDAKLMLDENWYFKKHRRRAELRVRTQEHAAEVHSKVRDYCAVEDIDPPPDDLTEFVVQACRNSGLDNGDSIAEQMQKAGRIGKCSTPLLKEIQKVLDITDLAVQPQQ